MLDESTMRLIAREFNQSETTFLLPPALPGEAARGQGCYLFSLDPTRSDATAYARFFNPTVGIWEDPATGSAAGPLACHLVAAGVVADGSTVVIEQGHRDGAPEPAPGRRRREPCPTGQRRSRPPGGSLRV